MPGLGSRWPARSRLAEELRARAGGAARALLAKRPLAGQPEGPARRLPLRTQRTRHPHPPHVLAGTRAQLRLAAPLPRGSSLSKLSQQPPPTARSESTVAARVATLRSTVAPTAAEPRFLTRRHKGPSGTRRAGLQLHSATHMVEQPSRGSSRSCRFALAASTIRGRANLPPRRAAPCTTAAVTCCLMGVRLRVT